MVHSFSALEKSSLIQKIEVVSFDEYAKVLFRGFSDREKLMEAAKAHSKQIHVYRILYRSGSHSVVGFLIEPRKMNGKTPCVIYNRDGSGEFGKIAPEHLFLRIARIASWGYIVIGSQYSGNDGGEGKDEFGGADLEDVLILQKILKKHPFADMTRIGMYGASRGGMMTYLCLAKVKWIKAAVCIAAPADLFRQEELRPEMKEKFRKMFGGKREELKKRSAVRWVKKFHKKTPVLMMHGSADWRVSPLDSLDMSKEMLREQIPHRFVLFEGADHRLTEFHAQRFEMTRLWLDRFVKNREKLPNLKLHGD